MWERIARVLEASPSTSVSKAIPPAASSPSAQLFHLSIAPRIVGVTPTTIFLMVIIRALS